jgi:hypothetical protein
LAYEYKWSKNDILDTVYFDEAWHYIKLAQRRKINDLRMLAFVHHGDPKETNKALDQMLRMVEPAAKEETPVLDKAGFAALRSVMAKSDTIQVK